MKIVVRSLKWMVTVALVYCGWSVRGEVYTVTGELKYDAFRSTYTEDHLFTVAVSNCIWAIEMLPTKTEQGKPHPQTQSSRQVYDGRTLFHIIRMKEPMSGQSGLVYVEENDMPSPGRGGFAPQLWLAYASHCSLAGRTAGLLKPITHLPARLRATDYITPARWELGPGSPGLPRHVEYMLDPNQWRESRGSPLPIPPGPWNGALPMWSAYEASDWTNISNITVPQKFVFTGFSPESELRNPEVRKAVYTISGTTSGVKRGVDAQLFDCVFKGMAVVDDARFWKSNRNQNRISYRITNSAPPGVESRWLLAAVAQEQAIAELQHQAGSPIARNRTKRHFLWLLTGAASAACVWVLIRKTKKQRKRKVGDEIQHE